MTARLAPRTASATTRAFFEMMDKEGISHPELARKCGIHENTLYYWRSGRSSATVINMEAVLSVLGLELVIRPINPSPTEEELLV